VARGLRVEEITPVSIKIAWDSISGASEYLIYYSTSSTSGSFTTYEPKRTTGTSYTYQCGENSPTWYFKVAAMIDGEEGTLSSYVFAKTPVVTVLTLLDGWKYGIISILSPLVWYKVDIPVISTDYFIEGRDSAYSGSTDDADIVFDIYNSVFTLVKYDIDAGNERKNIDGGTGVDGKDYYRIKSATVPETYYIKVRPKGKSGFDYGPFYIKFN
jgi:hypothetical protein